ncbi:MAG: EAL domain-containing protein [Gemmatimonadota bacterium]
MLVGVGLALAVAFVPELARVREWLLEVGRAQLTVAGGVVAVGVLGLALHRLRETRILAQQRALAEQALRPPAEVVEATRDGVAMVGRSDTFVYVNLALARLFGYTSPRELFGRAWRTLFAAEQVGAFDREILPAFRRSGRWVGEVEGRRRDGGTVALDLSLSPMVGGGVTWVVREASWRRAAEEKRLQEEARFRNLFQAAGSAIVLLSPAGEILEWNREAARLHGASRDEVLGRDFLEICVPESLRPRVASELEAVRTGQGTLTFHGPTGEKEEPRILLWNLTSLDGGHRAEGELVAVGQDITEHRRAEVALEEQENLYRLLAHNSSDLVALHSPDGRFEYVSPSCEPLLGCSPEELLGKDLFQVSHSDDWKGVQTALVATGAGRPSRLSYRLRGSTGEYVWMETLLRPIRDDRGEITQLLSSSRDISERKTFEEQLRFQALHEPLTGLPNRTLFLDRLNQALARSRRQGNSVAVMFMDLDRFKVINDSLGHAAGDRLLAAVARRIQAVVREADTVARLGGDEFGILLEFNIAQRDVGKVAERVLEQLRPPFTFAGTDVFVNGSVGIAFSTPETESAEDLLRYADVAMYRAKEAGSGNYRIYDPDVDSQATRRLEMETALRRALEREQLFLLYQPIVELASGRVSGVEALIRWRHPEWGLVGPDEFIPLAEETGLIIPIGNWVLERACREVRQLERDLAGLVPTLSVSVNLSVRQFETSELDEVLARVLAAHEAEPELLHLEITETELIQNTGRIRQLKEQGVRVSVDDFGTGYSSLAYLKDLPVDELKVDRSFVNGLAENPHDAAIVETVVTLAKALGLDVTAEGVETADQLARLRALGCRRGQGFHFARPSSLEELRALLEKEPVW